MDVDVNVDWKKFPVAFQRACMKTLIHEGKWSNNKFDRGGATHYGITAKTAARHGFTLPFQRLEDAVGIYYREFWPACGAPLFADVSTAVALELFDTGVISGPSTAIRLLQQAYNVLYTPRRERLTEDGVLGPKTVQAVSATLRQDEMAVVFAMNGEQYLYFKSIKESDPTQVEFIKGWIGKRLTVTA